MICEVADQPAISQPVSRTRLIYTNHMCSRHPVITTMIINAIELMAPDAVRTRVYIYKSQATARTVAAPPFPIAVAHPPPGARTNPHRREAARGR